MKHRRLTCVSLLGAPAALPAGVLFYVYISVLPQLLLYDTLCAYVTSYILLLRSKKRPSFLPAQASLPLPAGAGNHTYFTL